MARHHRRRIDLALAGRKVAKQRAIAEVAVFVLGAVGIAGAAAGVGTRLALAVHAGIAGGADVAVIARNPVADGRHLALAAGFVADVLAASGVQAAGAEDGGCGVELALTAHLVAKQLAVAGVAVLVRGAVGVAGAHAGDGAGHARASAAIVARGAGLAVRARAVLGQVGGGAGARRGQAHGLFARVGGRGALDHGRRVDLAGVGRQVAVQRAVAQIVVFLSRAIGAGLACADRDATLTDAGFAGRVGRAVIAVLAGAAVGRVFAAKVVAGLIGQRCAGRQPGCGAAAAARTRFGPVDQQALGTGARCRSPRAARAAGKTATSDAHLAFVTRHRRAGGAAGALGADGAGGGAERARVAGRYARGGHGACARAVGVGSARGAVAQAQRRAVAHRLHSAQ